MTETAAPRTLLQLLLLEELARKGTWTGLAALQARAHAAGCSDEQLDDEIAQLCDAGQAEYSERTRSLRLVGTPMARAALRRLVRAAGEGGDVQRVDLVRFQPDGGVEMGTARLVPQPGGKPLAVMAQVNVPAPDTAAGVDLLAVLEQRLNGVVAALRRGDAA